MKHAGIDLHKHSISVCVMNEHRKVIARRKLGCADEEAIAAFFAGLGEFQGVVEATAGYRWLIRRIEPLAHRVVLAHPRKLRVIAESTRKSDKLDAQMLAEMLALDMIPTSYVPTPRQQDHRRLVRLRAQTVRRVSAARVQVRRLLADENADFPALFTRRGQEQLGSLALPPADRFAVEVLLERWRFLCDQRRRVEAEIAAFAERGSSREQEQRALLRSIPGVGPVTVEVALAELADIGRFASQKRVVAYAGLAPGQRESAGKRKELHLEKTGSKLLRTTLIEAAWRLIRQSQRWRKTYEQLKKRLRAKKAIVAIARRLLTVMHAVLTSGRAYRHAAA
jgi:transposase